MKKIFRIIALILLGHPAYCFPGPQINGNQINPQTGISVSSLTATGVNGTQTTQLNASGQITTQSTMTVQGNAFSVNSNNLVVSGGNVGIGTTNPQAPLDVHGNGSLPFQWGNNTTAGVGFLSFSGTNAQIGATTTSSSMTFVDGNGGIAMTITPPGNIGIGTIVPNFKLDVNGPIFTEADRGFESQGTGNVWIMGAVGGTPDWRLTQSGVVNAISVLGTSGNVGILTTTPQGTLDVSGSFYLSPSTSNVAGAWFSWSPAVVGCVTPSINTAKYMKVGKTLSFFIDISCTSNATNFNFQLPFVFQNPSQEGLCWQEDNTVLGTTPGAWQADNVNSQVDLLKTPFGTLNSWTNSGTKRALCWGTIEVQ